MQTIGKSNQDRHLCDDCIYRARGDRVVNNCDYIFITGHSRGCPADECTVYETGKRKAVRRLSDVSDTNVGDTISRQAAIDAVSEACFELRGIFKECEERLLALPSAQPDYYNISDIDEIWEYYAKEHDLNLTENAQQIKEALWLGYHKGKESAQPKTGYWIEDKKTERENQLMFHKVWTCSQCGEQQVRPKPSNFCPNCGTAMPGIITMYT